MVGNMLARFDSRFVAAVAIVVIAVAAYFVFRQVAGGSSVQPSDIHMKVPNYDPNAGAPGGATQSAGGR